MVVMSLPLAVKIALALLVLAAAGYDYRYRKIPNWLNLSGLVLGLGFNTLLGGKSGFYTAAAGLLLAFAIYLPLYVIKGMGSGDVKLMVAIGSLTGPSIWLEIFLATSLLGGLAAACLVLSEKRLHETCWNVFGILHDLRHFRAPYVSNTQLDIRDSRALRMPHGVTIAIGCASAALLGSSFSRLFL